MAEGDASEGLLSRLGLRRGLAFQGGRGGWLLGSLGVNVGLSGLPGM